MKIDKTNQFIIRLIKMTKNNEIEWRSIRPQETELPNGSIILDKKYETELEGKTFELYRYKYKFYTDEYSFEWSQKIQLNMLDVLGHTDYEFEYTNSINDLFDIVREKCSNVGNIIDNILGLQLEIIEASYYTTKKGVDITEKLKAKIIENKLNIIASNDIAGDPDFGTKKKLKIKYKYLGEITEIEVIEGEIINLPFPF